MDPENNSCIPLDSYTPRWYTLRMDCIPTALTNNKEVSMLKTLADIKRLPVGTELYCTRNHSGECRLYRKIEKVQGNSFAFSGDGVESGKRSWTWFPKASLVECDGNTFKFYFDDTKTRFISYELKEGGE